MQFVGVLHCIFALLQVYWLMIVDKWVNYLKKCAWLFDEICFKMVSCFQHLAVVACSRAAIKASTTTDSWTSSPKMFRRNYIYSISLSKFLRSLARQGLLRGVFHSHTGSWLCTIRLCIKFIAWKIVFSNQNFYINEC